MSEDKIPVRKQEIKTEKKPIKNLGLKIFGGLVGSITLFFVLFQFIPNLISHDSDEGVLVGILLIFGIIAVAGQIIYNKLKNQND